MYAVALLLSCGLFAQQITLSDIWEKGTFTGKSINEIRSMKDGEHYCVLTYESIDKYEYASGKKIEEILNFNLLQFPAERTFVFDYRFSADEQKILLAANPYMIYRYSYLADYYVYDLKTRELKSLCEDKVRLAEFSPDGQKVAYVRDNNLYIKSLDDMLETAVTNDGKTNEIINGTTDWVYEEEFGITKGFFWSPDSKRIAFYKFDESNVREYGMTIYGELYPRQYKYKYPKAGEANSVVEIFVYELESGRTSHIDMGADKDIYLPRLQWTLNNEVFIHKLNRHQNVYELFVADCDYFRPNKVYEERNEYYIEQVENVDFLSDGKNFVIKSERDGYANLYKINIYSREIEPLTTGRYDVERICFIDDKDGKIYFTAAQSEAYNRELLVVDGKKQVRKLSGAPGTNTAESSANGKYYI